VMFTKLFIADVGILVFRWLTRYWNLWRRLLALATMLHTLINVAIITCVLVYVSRLNYPGGVAMRAIHSIESKSLGKF